MDSLINLIQIVDNQKQSTVRQYETSHPPQKRGIFHFREAVRSLLLKGIDEMKTQRSREASIAIPTVGIMQ